MTMDPSASPPSASATVKPPEGWTVDPTEMKVDYNWKPTSGPGTRIASVYGLKDPSPIMSTDVKSGVPIFMFSSSGKLYLWGIMDGVVWEIQTRGSPQEIADKIGEGGVKSLEIEEAKLT